MRVGSPIQLPAIRQEAPRSAVKDPSIDSETLPVQAIQPVVSNLFRGPEDQLVYSPQPVVEREDDSVELSRSTDELLDPPASDPKLASLNQISFDTIDDVNVDQRSDASFLQRVAGSVQADQQRAIDFYNFTAVLGRPGGEGELIGIDTFA